MSLPVPSVIRLHHFVRVPYRNRVPLSRRAVFARDGHRCQYCNRAAENIDHVVPRSRGGPHAWDNVVASCRSCNARKEDRLLADSGLNLRRQPREPHANLWVVATAGTLDPAWEPYLPPSPLLAPCPAPRRLGAGPLGPLSDRCVSCGVVSRRSWSTQVCARRDREVPVAGGKREQGG